ncbi:hypothetical protein D3C80_1156150 [compost metagenome]
MHDLAELDLPRQLEQWQVAAVRFVNGGLGEMLAKMRNSQYHPRQTDFTQPAHHHTALFVVYWPVVAGGQQKLARLQPIGDLGVIDDVNPGDFAIHGCFTGHHSGLAKHSVTYRCVELHDLSIPLSNNHSTALDGCQVCNDLSSQILENAALRATNPEFSQGTRPGAWLLYHSHCGSARGN